jgi:arsenate reductase-like glutaredoxin family protein
LRFFRERRISVSFLDVAQRPLAPAELRRFVDRFGAPALLDRESRAFADGGLGYLRMNDAEVADRIASDQRLLRLPLVRSGQQLSVGQDADAWKRMVEAERTA